MAKIESNILRTLSVLVGVMIGGILAYFYNTIVGLPIADFSEYDLWNMLTFVTIPALAGFVAGLIDNARAMENGLFSGFFTGAINFLMSIYLAAIRAKEEELTYESEPFVFFLVLSVFLWMIIGAVAGRLAKEYKK